MARVWRPDQTERKKKAEYKKKHQQKVRWTKTAQLKPQDY